MSILVDKNTRLVVQGITGREGGFQTRRCIEYGTNVVAGVTPGRGGETAEGAPVFNTVREAVQETNADCSLIFVPAAFAADAILEAADAGIEIVVCISEGIPARDMVRVQRILQGLPTRLIGGNCPGIITPGASKVGVMPAHIFMPGVVGVVSRSGTLTYEVAGTITACGVGQTTCVGIGGDPVTGLSFIDVIRLFETDDQTRAVVILGEIGGNAEEIAAQYIEQEGYSKPIIAYVAGRAAPPGKRMGHAGAIITGTQGTANSKIEALAAAGVIIAEKPSDVATILTKKV